MGRFQRDFGLNAGLPSPSGELAASRLAGSFRAFGEIANRFGARLSQAEAVAEAGSLRPSTEAPELRSPLTIYGRTYNELVTKGHLAAVSNAVNQRINRFAAEFPSDPIAFTENVNSVRGEFLNEVSPEARTAAEIFFDTTANNHLFDIQTRHFEDMRAASILSQTEALDNVKISAVKALQNGDEAAFFDMFTVFQQAALSSDLTAEGKVQAMIDFKQEANLALVTAEIAELFDRGNPRAAIKLLNDVRDGNLNMIFADTGMSAGEAADLLQIQFEKRLGDFQIGLRIAQQRKALAKIEAGEASMNLLADNLTAFVTNVIEQDFQGAVSEEKRKHIIFTLGEEDGEAWIRAIEGFSNPNVQFDPTDTDDKKTLNTVFRHYIGRDSLTSGQGGDELVKMSVKAQVVPSEASRLLSAMLVSENEGAAEFSLRTMDQLFQSNPEMVLRDFKKKDINALVYYQERVETMSFEDIEVNLRLMRDPTRQESRKALRADGDEIAAKFELDNIMDDVFDLSILPFNQPDAPIDQLASRQIVLDYQRMFSDAYILSGDEPLAKQQAAAQMQIIWGASDANGGRVMKFPPERYAPAINGDFEWMREQLISETVAALNIPTKRTKGVLAQVFGPGFLPKSAKKEIPGIDIYLVPVRETAIDVQNGVSPRYQVIVKEDGVHIPVMDDNGPMLFQFDPTDLLEKERKEFNKERKNKIDFFLEEDPSLPFGGIIKEVPK